MKEANKHFYYAYSRSNLVNGLQVGVAVPDFVPWWQATLIAVDVVLGVLVVVSVAAVVCGNVLNRKRKEEE